MVLTGGNEKEILKLKKQIKSDLIEVYKTNKNSNDASVKLLTLILGDQLNIKRIDRGQLHMAIQVLNKRLGIVSAMNCKSGLDRTGYQHALARSLYALSDEESYKLVMAWPQIAKRGQNLAVVEKKLVDDFRKRFLTHIQEEALPITLANRGIMGMRWGTEGFFKNRVPWDFLPDDCVIFDGKGQTKGLSDKGRALIGFSNLRSS